MKFAILELFWIIVARFSDKSTDYNEFPTHFGCASAPQAPSKTYNGLAYLSLLNNRSLRHNSELWKPGFACQTANPNKKTINSRTEQNWLINLQVYWFLKQDQWRHKKWVMGYEQVLPKAENRPKSCPCKYFNFWNLDVRTRTKWASLESTIVLQFWDLEKPKVDYFVTFEPNKFRIVHQRKTVKWNQHCSKYILLSVGGINNALSTTSTMETVETCLVNEYGLHRMQ